VIPVYEECESQLAVRAGIARRAVTIFPYGSPTTSGWRRASRPPERLCKFSMLQSRA